MTGDEQGKCCGIKNKITNQNMTPKRYVATGKTKTERNVEREKICLRGTEKVERVTGPKPYANIQLSST